MVIRDAAKKYYLALRQARVLAAMKKIETAVLINPDDGSYTIANVRKARVEGENRLTFNPVKRFVPPGGITIEGDDIFFYPLGGSSGGKILIKDNEDRLYRIQVDKITGKIRLERLS